MNGLSLLAQNSGQRAKVTTGNGGKIRTTSVPATVCPKELHIGWGMCIMMATNACGAARTPQVKAGEAN